VEELTPKMAAALRDSHLVAVQADIVRPGLEPVTVPVIGGDVSGDRTAQVRRTGRLLIPWRLDLPGSVTGVELDLRELPFGSYADLYRGVRYADGTADLVRLGYLRIDTVTYGSDNAEAELALSDRYAQVIDEKLMYPLSAKGQLPAKYAVHLVTEVFGTSITYTVTVPDAAQPTLDDVTFDTERGDAVAVLCRAVAAEGYFDTAGNFRVDGIPDPGSTPPVWTIDAGLEGVMIASGEAYDRQGIYNGVLIRGQTSLGSHEFQVLVTVTDPTSPLRWGGPFGKVLHIEQSNAYGTKAAAQTAAQTMLSAQLGLTRTITLHAVPNPALAPSDVIRVAFPDGRDETHVIDTIVTPLDPVAPIELTTRLVYTGALSELFSVATGPAAVREARRARALV
jgi:hypothetical protein